VTRPGSRSCLQARGRAASGGARAFLVGAFLTEVFAAALGFAGAFALGAFGCAQRPASEQAQRPRPQSRLPAGRLQRRAALQAAGGPGGRQLAGRPARQDAPRRRTDPRPPARGGAGAPSSRPWAWPGPWPARARSARASEPLDPPRGRRRAQHLRSRGEPRLRGRTFSALGFTTFGLAAALGLAACGAPHGPGSNAARRADVARAPRRAAPAPHPRPQRAAAHLGGGGLLLARRLLRRAAGPGQRGAMGCRGSGPARGGGSVRARTFALGVFGLAARGFFSPAGCARQAAL